MRQTCVVLATLGKQLSTVVLCVAAVSCGPNKPGASEPIPAATTTSYTTFVGGKVGISPGTEVGYALTSPAVKTYQFRWTGDDAVTGDGYKEFYGSVWTTGTFTSLTPGCTLGNCPLESGDFVSTIQTVPGGQRIDWDTFASDGWDGFSFTTDTEPVFFDVYVDGNRRPDLFFFPAAPAPGTPTNPTATPFGMSSSD